MELYNKILIKNENAAKNLIDDWNSNKWWHMLKVEDFDKYPAIVCYFDDENDYSMSHSATVYYSIVYLDDFENF